MALPVDFIERVLAWPSSGEPGYVNAHWQAPAGKGGGMRGRPFTDLTEFMDFVQYAATKPGTYKEVFFCLSTQRDRGKLIHDRWTAHRHASKAIKLKAIWLDVDVKPQEPEKAYISLPLALAAINEFVSKADLPVPSALVFSGGGVHVYWIADRGMTPEEWRPFAEGLKAEAINHGLKCDPGITSDCARVLRVPGTFNNKIQALPRPVKLAHLGASYNFDTDAKLQHIKSLAPARVSTPVTVAATTPAFQLPAAFAAGPAQAFAQLDAAGDTLASDIGRRSNDLPLDVSELFKNCTHFRDSFLAHGRNHSQGLWMLTGLASTWLDNGRKIFHTLSKGYPTYTPDETDAMYDRKMTERKANDLGWPSCKAFEGEGAKCKTCPFYGKLRSPLHLAERVAPPDPVAPLPPPPDELELPEGYTIDENGLICEIMEKTLPNGEQQTVYVEIFWSKLRNLFLQGGDRRLVFETSLDKGHWKSVSISEAVDLINEITIIKALRLQGVKPNPRIAPKQIITFMTSFMKKLDEARERQRTTAFGWLRADEQAMPTGFAYGGRVIMADGGERSAGYSDQQLEAFYKPKGSPEPWWDLLHLVTAQHHPALEAIICTSFAAPLQAFTGLYNTVINSWSNGSGAHKSTSLDTGSAVWANPKLTKERPLSTNKGILKKLGSIKNLPVYWDEINSDAKMDEVREILGLVTEGSSGSRLRSDRSFADYEEWQTLIQVGANKSLVENIFAKVKGTDAQLQRVFEYQVEKRGMTAEPTDVDRLVGSLAHNYGHMGLTYSKLLGTNVARVDELVKASRKRFEAQVSARDEERFRCCVAATIHAGAVLANEIGCNFNVEEIWDFMKEAFLAQRKQIAHSDIVAGTADNSANALTQFIKTYTKNCLWVGGLPNKKLGQPEAITYIAGPRKDHPEAVHVRLAVNDHVIDVSRTKLFDYLALKEYTPSAVLDGLTKHYGAFENGRANLAAGSGVAGGREPIIRIPVEDNGPFASDLYANTPIDQRPLTVAVTTGIETPQTPKALAGAMAQAAVDLNVVRTAA